VHTAAATENLGRLATSLRLKHKSTTAVLTVPAGLNLTNQVEISILWDSLGRSPTRATQNYNNATGNRFLFYFPADGGAARLVQSDITLAEKSTDGQLVGTYSVLPQVTIRPLYDITVSPIVAELLVDCDTVGASEVILGWAGPDGVLDHIEISTFGRETFTVYDFARTFNEVGSSAGQISTRQPELYEPLLLFREDDPGGFHPFTPARPSSQPLLPGHDHSFDRVLFDAGDANCGLWVRYSITYVLREYPFLE
jgi:hypothetical protein